MDPLPHLEDVYSAIRTLIVQLEGHGRHGIAAQLQYLMKDGCWNSWAELLEAVAEVLSDPAISGDWTTGTDVRNTVQSIRKAIARLLTASLARP